MRFVPCKGLTSTKDVEAESHLMEKLKIQSVYGVQAHILKLRSPNGKKNEREWFLFMNPQKYFSSTVKEGHVVWWKE